MLGRLSVCSLAVSASLAFAAPTVAQQINFDGILQRFNEFYLAGNFDKALSEARKYEAAVRLQSGTNHTNYAKALNNIALAYEG